MKIEFTIDFRLSLEDQIRFISKDKPKAARVFKSALIKSIKKDLTTPFQFKKSKYFENECVREYIFKGYSILYFVDLEMKIITVFGFIKYKNTL
jgi:mRNA-degrading endonuclease RelE of RelBE toxin-antitoxin system